MKSELLVENIQGVTPKASTGEIQCKPATVAGRLRAATEDGSDFYQLTSMENLFQCWIKTRKNKSQRFRIQKFSEDPLRYLAMIQQRLRARTFEFGPYKYFKVREKKMRDVVDAPMKDRIVHWMLYDYLLPIWQPRFIHDTYGNLPGRGTHIAVRRLSGFCRKPENTWALQLDISKYFYSVPHDLLKERSTRYVGDFDVRRLLADLIDSYRTDGRFDELFAEDSPYRRTLYKGMPIGNLSSQLFANLFLCDFDHWVKEVLGVRHYIRYVDDIVIVGRSIEELRFYRDKIVEKLNADGLCAHPFKTRLAPVTTGIPFLGYVVWPNHVSAGRHMLNRYHRSLRIHEAEVQDRTDSLRSYRAMLNHTGIFF